MSTRQICRLEGHFRGRGQDNFREGNGRVQRAFLAQLARDAGYRIRRAAMDAEVYVAASAAAHRGDNILLRAMFEELVEAHGDAAPAPPRPRLPPEQ
jgi:cell filamentation protein